MAHSGKDGKGKPVACWTVGPQVEGLADLIETVSEVLEAEAAAEVARCLGERDRKRGWEDA